MEMEMEMDRPKWADTTDPVSSVVNWLIGIKPLFGLMKIGARKTLISTAEENGIPWVEQRQNYYKSLDKFQNLKTEIEKDDIDYPNYYTKEFHAYDEGNLNWNAAFEVESATLSMALRVWPDENLTYTEAQDRLRYSFLDALDNYRMQQKQQQQEVKTILDVGCSVGVSSFYLHDRFNKNGNSNGNSNSDSDSNSNGETKTKTKTKTKVIGLDLSPHFLSVAQSRQAMQTPHYDDIEWMHALAEETGLASDSIDITAISFLFHELPTAAATKIVKELYRVTKPSGGTIAITDNNPKSKVIQSLPPAIFTLMKSTEPWSDEYYALDIEKLLQEIGFVNVVTVESDPRHRTILASKP